MSIRQFPTQSKPSRDRSIEKLDAALEVIMRFGDGAGEAFVRALREEIRGQPISDDLQLHFDFDPDHAS